MAQELLRYTCPQFLILFSHAFSHISIQKTTHSIGFQGDVHAHQSHVTEVLFHELSLCIHDISMHCTSAATARTN